MIIDTGPIVALFNRRDNHHVMCKLFFETYTGTLFTTWLVLTEVSFLLPHHLVVPFLDWVVSGGLTVVELSQNATTHIAQLMRKYHDRPMDLADASLVCLADRLGILEILTIDHADFAIYRTSNGSAMNDVLASY
jgi:predicted nucleic acid-binding protein